MTVTVKLDPALEAQLRLRASLAGTTASEVIRAALTAYLAAPDAALARSAHDLGADLFGRHSGAPELATTRKRELATLWADKQKTRPLNAPLVAAEPSPPYGQHLGPVLVDGGPLVALFNGADRWHARVVDWLRANPAARLVATWPVATEVCMLLSRRIGNDAALDFLRWSQRGGIVLEAAVDGSLAELLRIGDRHADWPFDLADASIAEAAARLKIDSVLSIDADTGVYGSHGGRPLRNLPRP